MAGIAYYLVSFRLQNVEIHNNSIYTDDEIRARLFTGSRIDGYTHLFAWKINHSSNEIPFVEKTDVEITDKNSVIIYVYGKIVTGCVEHMGKYVHFDREGTVVETAAEPLEGIPVIEGLKFDDVIMGKKLEMGDSKLFDKLLLLLKLLEKNSLHAEKVVFGLRNDITLHMQGNVILLGTEGDTDYKIGNLANVMKAMVSEYGEGKYRVDMRLYSEENREVTARIIEDDGNSTSE